MKRLARVDPNDQAPALLFSVKERLCSKVQTLAKKKSRKALQEAIEDLEAIQWLSAKALGTRSWSHQEVERILARATGDVDREIAALRKSCQICRRFIVVCVDEDNMTGEKALSYLPGNRGLDFIAALEELDAVAAKRERRLLESVSRRIGARL
jgi:hypothetical protein